MNLNGLIEKIISMWTGMKPQVKIVFFICITLIIIASMITGYFPELICFFSGGKE